MPPARTPPKEGEPRTLFEAKQLIARLRKQMPNTSAELGLSIPPVYGTAGTKPPDGKPIKPLDPGRPNPHPGESPPKAPGYPPPSPGNLGTLPPKMLAQLLEQKTDQELTQMLSAENSKSSKTHDAHYAMQIYREIKRRK